MYEIYALMAQIGITSKYKGYDYVAAAVKYLLDRPDQKVSATKEIYPDLGRVFHVPPARIEQNIRFIINVIWEKRRGLLERRTGLKFERRPTNSEFLDLLVGLLQDQND